MSDPRIAEATEIVSRLWHSFPEEAVQPIACALAAAEERGRRRGVEEALAVLRGFTRVEVAEVAVRELLAPRDSAPKKHRCMRCGGEFECTAKGCVAGYDVLPRMVRDGVVVEHECKPRDSGKVG